VTNEPKNEESLEMKLIIQNIINWTLQTTFKIATLKVYTAVKIQVKVFWVVTLHNVARSDKMLTSYSNTTQRHISQELNLKVCSEFLHLYYLQIKNYNKIGEVLSWSNDKNRCET